MNEKVYMQICNQCVLDSHYPGITFNEAGTCNYCVRSRGAVEQGTLRKKYELKFLEVVERYKGKRTYDCLLAYSGGKDSTFTLDLLKNKYHLRVLAVTFDNWFQSETARENIRNVIMRLNMNHIYITPGYELFKQIMQVAVNASLFPPKALERATSICTTCLSLIRFTCIRMAIEMDIPMVITGLSPGQAPIATSVLRLNAKMLRSMQEVVAGILRSHLGDEVNVFFLEERHFSREDAMPYNVNPLSFLNYNEKEMYDVISKLGWRMPEDTDSNSTNCLLNALANTIHQEHLGYHPYAFEIAGLVRDGHMTREQGLTRLSTPPDEKIIMKVKEELGIC